MEQIPARTSGSNVWKIAAIIALLCACVCLGALGIFGGIFGAIFSGISSMEKTYYPECETTAGNVCKTCCEQRGHNGYSAGELVNEPGKTCGCL